MKMEQNEYVAFLDGYIDGVSNNPYKLDYDKELKYHYSEGYKTGMKESKKNVQYSQNW